MSAPSPAESPKPIFSPKRAFLHAVAWMGLFLVVAVVVQLTGKVASPERFQSGVIRAGFFVGLLGFLSAWLLDTRRTLAGRLLQGLLIIGIAALAVLPFVAKSHGPVPLTEAERQGLEATDVDGQARLVHPTLGFSIASPGPGFAPLAGPTATALEGHWAQYPEMYGEGWQDAATGRLLLIVFAKGLEEREELEGLARGMRESVTGAFQVDVLDDTVTWNDREREAHYEGRLPNGLYLETRSVVTELGADDTPFVVVLVALTPQEGGLRDVLQSFEPR